MRQRSAGAILLFASAIPALCQPPTTQLSFEVADVKINKSGETRMAVDFQGGGKLSMHNVPMKVLIMFAYHVRAEAVEGWPGWFESDRFDVVAKAAQTTPPDDLRRMLQTLLAERFKLVVHNDQKLMPAYALILGKSGPKLQLSEPAILMEQRCDPAAAPSGLKHVACHHLTMAVLADTLQELSPRDFDVPVIDQTGLKGAYDFNLDWAPPSKPGAEASSDAVAGLTIFGAVEAQLGLKVERKKLPLPIIVIDHVERVPADN
jgi:uncharacterized protein (TIGR03435 family)